MRTKDRCVMICGLFAVLVIAFDSTAAWAQFALSPTFYYSTVNAKDDNESSNGDTRSQETDVDLRVGLIIPDGIYIGALYGVYSGNGRSSGDDSSLNASHYGPSLGIIMGSFNLIGTYFISGERVEKLTSTLERRYSGESGFQIDLGWNFMISPSMGLGPQFSYTNLSWKKRVETSNGVATDGEKNYRRTEIYPRLAIWFVL